MTEQIWALPSQITDKAFPQPFTAFDEEELYDILDEQTIIGDRDKLEHDHGYKQIIPYVCVVNPRGQYFRYARAGGEERLVSKLSIGVGGHVNIGDVIAGSYSDEIVFLATMRELHEEFSFESIDSIHYAGVINSNEDDVGQVHLGIVLFATVGSSRWHCNEPGAISVPSCAWRSAEELMIEYESHESWSKILISTAI